MSYNSYSSSVKLSLEQLKIQDDFEKYRVFGTVEDAKNRSEFLKKIDDKFDSL